MWKSKKSKIWMGKKGSDKNEGRNRDGERGERNMENLGIIRGEEKKGR